MDDIVHELAHAVEEKYNYLVYGDGFLEREFTIKRKKLENILKHYNVDTEHVDFYNVNYDEDFDDFLYQEVGYEKLSGMITNIFLDPYSLTSLREYFATGFEKFYIGNRLYLKEVCPYLYKNILFLHEGRFEENENEF